MKFTDLTEDIFQVIREFVSIPIGAKYVGETPFLYKAKEERFFSSLLNLLQGKDPERDWTAFLNTTKLFREIKRATIFLILAGCHALRYLEDQTFRNRVDGLVNDRSKQISIYGNEERFCSKPSRIYSKWNGLHSLLLQNLYDTFPNTLDLSVFHHLTVLYLFSSTLTSVPALSSLQILNLISCPNCSSIAHLPSLKELYLDTLPALKTISTMPALAHLHVRECPLLDLPRSLIENVQSSISLDKYWTSSEALSWFGHLTSIELSGLTVDINVSMFSNAVELLFQQCPKLKFVEDLPRLQKLTITNCSAFQQLEFQTLPSLQTIFIRDCNALSALRVEYPLVLNKNQNSPPVIKSLTLLNCPKLVRLPIYRPVLNLESDAIVCVKIMNRYK